MCAGEIFSATLSAETAFTKVLLIAGANAPIISGKGTGTTETSWNACEVYV